MNKLILETIKGQKVDRPPVWLMRQAGRYLPEYRKLRKTAGSFLNMCYNPEFAAEVTMQPIRRFGFDAAIIFSDILVIPHALGSELDYIEGKGPVLSKITCKEDVNALKTGNVENHLKPVFEALKLTREQLDDDKALIGFAGSPWTVATYMIEGGGSKNFENIRQMAFSNPDLLNSLINILVEETSIYLIEQINSGADIIQIFDSWAGVLPEKQFEDFVIKPNAQIVKNVRAIHPDVPITGFPKGAGLFYEKFINHTGVDTVGIDYTVAIKYAADVLSESVCVQGNLDPYLLASNKDGAIAETKRIIEEMKGKKFIFNLGHGILPHTPIKNVEALIETIRG